MRDRTKLPQWAKNLSDEELDSKLDRERRYTDFSPQCPSCKGHNTRLTVINIGPTQWHCRECFHDWEFEPDNPV